MYNPRWVPIAPLVLTILLTLGAAAQAVPAGQKPQIRFAKPAAYDSGALAADAVALADLNGDGKLDLVVANEWQNGNSAAGEVSVLLGNGDGTFQPAATYATGAYYAEGIAVRDVNGDGIPDLVAVSFCLNLNQNGNCTGIGGLSVLLGNGDGTFQPAITYGTGAYGAASVAIADLRGDGVLDLVVVNQCLPDCYTGSASVLLGNGDGTFQTPINYSSGGVGPDSVAIVDLKGDGIPDLVVANRAAESGGGLDGTASVLLGNGDGTFQSAVTYDSGSTYTNSVAVGDLRGNGILDLVVASGRGNNVLGVLLGSGDGTFQPSVNYLLNGIVGGEVTIGDLNGDGIPDLAVTDGCIKLKRGACTGAKVIVLLGNGDGTFQSPIEYGAGGYGASAIAIGDVNSDGRPDLVVADSWQSPGNPEGSVAVLLNETYYASKTTVTASPSPAQVNQQVTFTATITPTPPNGELVTFYNGKTRLGTDTTKNGVASLTASFAAAKTYTIKTNYTGDAFRKASAGTVKVVVNP